MGRGLVSYKNIKINKQYKNKNVRFFFEKLYLFFFSKKKMYSCERDDTRPAQICHNIDWFETRVRDLTTSQRANSKKLVSNVLGVLCYRYMIIIYNKQIPSKVHYILKKILKVILAKREHRNKLLYFTIFSYEGRVETPGPHRKYTSLYLRIFIILKSINFIFKALTIDDIFFQ